MSDIPDLPASTILMVEVGSTAHGTNIVGQDDVDQMAVVVESPRDVFGLGPGYKTRMQRTQPEGVRSGPGDIDRTLYSLRTFLSLAAAGNPSIQMAFYSPVLHVDGYGLELRMHHDWFIGRHIIPKYRGYMKSQSERLLGLRGGGHGKRGGGQRLELVCEHGYDTKYAMHAARLGFQCLELLNTGRLELPIGGEQGDWLRAVRRGEVPAKEWWDQVLDLDNRLKMMLDDEGIPRCAQVGKIETWSARVHQLMWRPS
jgi:hypothetical protein